MAKVKSKSLGNVILWLTADGKKLDTALERADKAVTAWAKRASKNLKDWGKGFQDLGAGVTKLGAVGAAGFAALGGAVYKCVEAYAVQEKAEKQLEAVLKSTQGAAGMTKEELLKLASGLQEVTAFGDEATIRAEALMLTFTQVGKDVFPQAIESVLDMSAALGQDLQSSTIQLGKALNDPIKGVTALQRVGVSFTAQQKEQIKGFVQGGQAAKAQGVILAELSKEFGGQARAMAETTDGRLTQIRNLWGDAMEAIGKAASTALIPMRENLLGGVKALQDWLANGGAEQIRTTLTQLFTSVGNVVKAFWEQIRPLREWLSKMMTENPKLIANILEIGAAITTISLILGPAMMTLGGFMISLSGFVTLAPMAFKAVGTAATFMAKAAGTSVLGLVGSIAGATFAVGVLYVAFQAFAEMLGSGNWTTNFLTRWVDETFPKVGKGIDWVFDKVVGLINGLSDMFKWWWGDLKKGFSYVGDFIGDVFSMALNGVIEAMNAVIAGINTVSGAVGIPEIPEIPAFAGGGVMQRSGLALVGERGPELVRLPAQARVFSNTQSRAMAGGLGGGVTVNVSSLVVREEADVERVARALARQIRQGMTARGALV